MYCDNKSTIALTKNPQFHDRTKHIDNKYHFIIKTILRPTNRITLEHISTELMLADGMTKPLGGNKLNYLVEELRLQALPSGSVRIVDTSSIKGCQPLSPFVQR